MRDGRPGSGKISGGPIPYEDFPIRTHSIDRPSACGDIAILFVALETEQIVLAGGAQRSGLERDCKACGHRRRSGRAFGAHRTGADGGGGAPRPPGARGVLRGSCLITKAGRPGSAELAMTNAAFFSRLPGKDLYRDGTFWYFCAEFKRKIDEVRSSNRHSVLLPRCRRYRKLHHGPCRSMRAGGLYRHGDRGTHPRQSPGPSAAQALHSRPLRRPQALAPLAEAGRHSRHIAGARQPDRRHFRGLPGRAWKRCRLGLPCRSASSPMPWSIRSMLPRRKGGASPPLWRTASAVLPNSALYGGSCPSLSRRAGGQDANDPSALSGAGGALRRMPWPQ